MSIVEEQLRQRKREAAQEVRQSAIDMKAKADELREYPADGPFLEDVVDDYMRAGARHQEAAKRYSTWLPEAAEQQ